VEQLCEIIFQGASYNQRSYFVQVGGKVVQSGEEPDISVSLAVSSGKKVPCAKVKVLVFVCETCVKCIYVLLYLITETSHDKNRITTKAINPQEIPDKKEFV
jgi:hypothetical protein